MAGILAATIVSGTEPSTGPGRYGLGESGHVAFSPDGRLLAVVSYYGVRLYDVATLSEIRLLQAKGTMGSCSFSPDGGALAVGSEEGAIRIWRVDNGQLLVLCQGSDANVLSVAFSPDGRTLAAASGDSDYVVRLWDPHSGALASELKGHSEIVWTVAYSPDGRYLASGDELGLIQLWQAENEELLHQFGVQFQGVDGLAFLPGGSTLASAGAYLRVWRVADEVLLWTSESTTDSPPLGLPTCVASAPNGQVLAVGTSDGAVQLWRTSDGDTDWVLQDILEKHPQVVRSVVFAPNGRTLISGSADGTVHLWQI